MGQAPIDAVLAGTKGFAVALLAPLTAKVGNRPRVAGDPGQVLGLCSGPSALAVIEFTGEGSIGAVQALVRDGRGVRVVAGLPPAHAGAEGTLRALGVEVGTWDGKIDGVIAAVDRVVADMAGAAPAAPRPAAKLPAAPASPGARPLAGAPAPAAARPPPAPARPPVAAPAPAAAHPAGAGTAPRPAAPAARSPAVAPAAPAPVPAATRAPAAAPVARPQPASVPAAARPAAAPQKAPAPAPRPGAPAAAAPRAPAAPVAAKPAPDVAPPPEAPAAAVPVVQPALAKPRSPAEFFSDLDTDVSVDVGEFGTQSDAPAALVDFHAPGVYVPPPPESTVDWPGGICSAAGAEDALRRALGGAVGASQPLHDLAVRTLDTLSDLERAVLAGEPQPIDAGPVRKAAVMRLRVAEGLASAPAPGSAVDTTALSVVLGEIDGLLAEVTPLLSAAPPELAPALEQIRNALVSEAIDFSEAAQRVAATGREAAKPAPVASARAAAARVLSFDSAQEVAVEKTERRRRWIGLAALGVVALLAIGYHTWRHFSRGGVQVQPTVAGAPSNTVASKGGGKVQLVVSKTGKFDPAELKRFQAEQELRGNRVEVVSPGVLKITPATEPAK